MSRTAVWKLVADLREAGVDIASVERRGYRLVEPCELLDAVEHPADGRVARRSAARPGRGCFSTSDSTNAHLYSAPVPPAGSPRIVFAEIQRAGRGRRGRSWLAPFGSGLTFSIAWTYPDLPADLSALGLAVGVQVADDSQGGGGERDPAQVAE